jgi:CelD/BcsL family acetyltransferase involved in cellulose biosynthesis
VESTSSLVMRVAPLSEALRSDTWRSLGGSMSHPFGEPRWAANWWACFGSGSLPLVLIAERDLADIAVVPMHVPAGGRTLELFGGAEVTDYLGPVCDEELMRDVAAGLARWTLDAAATVFERFDFRFMPPACRFATGLGEALEAGGAEVSLVDDGVVSKLVLASSWQEQLGRMPAKQRHEIGRKRRRFEVVTGASPLVRRSDPDSLLEDIERFVALHRLSRGRKARFFTPGVTRFFTEMARGCMRQGEFALEFLEVAGRPLAATVSFERGPEKFLYNMAYDPEAGSVSPGIVLVAELIRDAIERGFGVFDLLRGDEEYKRRLGAEMLPLFRLKADVPARRRGSRRTGGQSPTRRNASPRA